MRCKKSPFVMRQNYFPNRFPEYVEGLSLLTDDNLLRTYCKLRCGLDTKWIAGIQNLQNFIDFHDTSVYTGTSGIALLHLRKDSKYFEYPMQYLGLERLRNKHQTFLCGDGGPLALGIIIYHRFGFSNGVNNLAKKLKNLSADVLNVNSDLPNGYMYGRAGYLYSIMYVNKNVNPPPFEDTFIREIIEAILLSGQNMAKAKNYECPLLYHWHQSDNLGAAHGLTGILYLLLQVKQYLTDDDLNQLIQPTIDFIKSKYGGYPSCDFPSPRGIHSNMVQWCKGAPGFLYLFCEAYKVFQKPEYLEIALECGDVIWKRGLLKKGYSLCHGVSGNAYCFLQLYQTTKDQKHLYRAITFAEWCFDYTRKHEEYTPVRPFSLYEGIAGPLYLLLDIQKPLEAKFPGFTL